MYIHVTDNLLHNHPVGTNVDVEAGKKLELLQGYSRLVEKIKR